ncbi:hypothetical protein [Aquicoccus porphyridii]|uniref:AAA+ family ATPase n=1 Tax=Aquicoccus porphyridii TaxID=1852029 RepID=A0A5A9ZV27_9RHOB|nr:hypothetical protein [Aquicoccus porphyridii]KAA0920782.1 hypothetical protein FLO80_00990 [Aquicoccus porphyridii]RAI56671.1 hypothetical protein DOO74_02085 [Rhodobacteraceae bacterium AsT-22]
MKHVLAIALSLCLAAPVIAQEQEDERGFSLMEEGARLFLEGIMREMEPALDDLREFSDEVEPGLRRFVEEMGPALGELMNKIDDFTVYHPPEMLPNGDIIIRRKTPLEQERDEVAPGDEIEL